MGSGDRPACLEALEPDGDGALTLFATAPAGNDATALAPSSKRLCRRIRGTRREVTRRGWLLLAALVWTAGTGYCMGPDRDSPCRRTCACSCRRPRTEEQRLLVQNVGESPATRLLLIAISGERARKTSPAFHSD